MNSDKKLIPNYRFPEFKNDGSWLLDKIGNIFTVTRGQVLSMNKVVENIDSENIYPVYSSQTKNGGLAGYYKYFLFQDAITWTTDGANAGDVNFRQGKFYCTNVCGVLLNSEGFANVFFAEILNTVTRSHVSYVGNPKLMNGVMSEIIIPFPKLKEQQKIAACLSSLDDVIAGHEEKLTALEEHKKGLMQNLFPQEGETQPKYRFPEFENDADWVMTNVKNCIKEDIIHEPRDGNHGNIHPKSSDFVSNGIPFIMASDLKYGKVDFNKCNFIAKIQADGLKKGFSYNGDVLLSHKGTVGEVAFLNNSQYEYFMLTPQVTYYRIKKSEILFNKFLFYVLKTNIFQSKLIELSGGGTRAYVGITEQQNLPIYYPISIEEQQKIASVLSSVDELIVAQREKIEALKEHKKGLMQGLFPKIES